MIFLSTSIFTVFLSVFIPVGTNGAVLTVGPTSVTVPIYGTTHFTCEGTGNELNWHIDSVPLTESIEQQRNISVTGNNEGGVMSSVLTITGLPVNDGLHFGCQIISYPPFEQVFSNTSATLTIRGISPVENIHWSNDDQLLSWSPPSFYSTDIFSGGIGATTYNVLVNGTSYINTTDTSVWLDISCEDFNVSIVASIAQYAAKMKKYINNTANYSISNENHSMNYDETDDTVGVNLAIAINSTQSCNCTINCTVNRDGEVTAIPGKDRIFTTSKKNETILYNMTGLDPCQRYTAFVEVLHSNGTDFISREQERFSFSTFSDVQGLQVSFTEGNGSVSVQCLYAESSTVDGCHVTFTHTVSGKNDSLTILGSDNSALISLPASGMYNVTAYDISDDGSIASWTCVETKEVDVTLITTDTSSNGFIAVSSSSSSTSISSSTLDITTPSPTGTVGSVPGNADSSMVYVTISVVFVLILMILIILFTLCVVIVTKRKHMNKVILGEELAACYQPQAVMSHYQETPIAPVAIDMLNDERSSVPTSGPVQGNIVDPYHVSTNELLAIRNRRSVQQNNSLVTTTSPQEGQTQNSSSPSSHESLGSPPNIANPLSPHDADPTVAVGSITAVYSVAGRITDADLVVNTPPAKYTGDISKEQPTCSSSSTYNSTTPLLPPGQEDDTATAYAVTSAIVAPTYASIAKRTDIAVPPAVQPSEYGEITGHIDKRGVLTTYPPPVPPKATQPTIDNDIHDEDDRHIPTNNTEAPPPAYDDIVVPTECSYPQEEKSDSTSGVSTSVYPRPSGLTVNCPIIHNNIHLHVGVEVNYGASSSSTSDYNSCPEVVVKPVQLPNKGPVDIEDDDRCLLSIVGTLSTPPPPSQRAASFSDTGTATTDTSTSKDHVSAKLPIHVHVGKGELFGGIQQQRHDGYNDQSGVLVMTCHVLKYRPNESSAFEDYNIEVTPIAVEESDSNNIEMFAPDNIHNKRPDESSAAEDEAIPIAVGDECGIKEVNKEGEVSSNDIELFSGGLEVEISHPIDSCVNVPFLGNPGAGITTLSHVISDTATGPFAESLFVDEHGEETERVNDINFKRRKKNNENGQKNAASIMSGKTKSKEILRKKKAIGQSLDPKKVFKRHKGSTKSATGFSSQRQANYSLSSKLCEAVWQFLYLKLSQLICIVNCIPFSDLNDVLVHDRSTIKSTVVGTSVWFESLNYKHRVRKRDKEQASIGKNHGTLYMLSLLFVYLLFLGIYNPLRVPIMTPIELLNILSSFNLSIPFAMYTSIIILLILRNFASNYFDLIQKSSSTTIAATSYLEPVDEIPHDPDPP